jgi:hypothetical protein
MPTPVGPVPRDPDDPELWDEWYDDDGDADDAEDDGAPRFTWPVRVVALLIVLGIVLLFVLSA